MIATRVGRIWPTVLAGLALVLVQPAAVLAGGSESSPREWAERVWSAAGAGSHEQVKSLLEEVPAEASEWLLESVERYRENLARQESTRTEKISEAEKELEEHLAEADNPRAISRALLSAVKLHSLSRDKDAFLDSRQTRGLIRDAEAAAERAERDGQWLVANEIYHRLKMLLEERENPYEEHAKRQTQRLSMIRLYAPEKFWELRNQRRVEEGEEELPPYNAMGDDYQTRLRGIHERMLLRALEQSSFEHVERIEIAPMLVGGLIGVRTLLETNELRSTFSSLRDDSARQKFKDYLNKEIRRIENARSPVRQNEIRNVVRDVVRQNRQTVRLPEEVILHEFGDGAMARLDEFSGIIWPDELRRFQRNTQGNFIGVGIQIQLDESLNIKVVTPLEGTPAQRAGIRAGDLIREIDGESTMGFTLEQAVDVITGPANTEVVLGIEREGREDLIKFPLKRARIEIRTVKGWQRRGAREDDWNWFIDGDRGIGYVRMTQFTEGTTKDFDRAVREMKREGLNALILDLRFNPGGLLDQAVSIANRFVSSGTIVRTQGANGQQRDAQYARRNMASLTDIPVIVLINEGSASASEIVSGAVQDYAEQGQLEALVLGERSFGKGSVQNVWPLPGGNAAMKLTTQYYVLPGGRLIDRVPGSATWGIDPDLPVLMLPDQVADSIMLRRDADVLPLNENGEPAKDPSELPDPYDLIREGTDLQLHTALLLLQARLSQDAVASKAR